ncbi:MAG: putative metal-dependent hydrolase [Sphingobacteriales bacterium JAD_PAG50586_3]|nr:MAG: putative metal-dependent hydrolase [Sphingobacteriales bacterium JAD_PAG50586_3]
MDIEKLRYPIGKYVAPEAFTAETITDWIKDIETLPQLIKTEVDGLDATALQQTYRPGGWTIQQLVHHCADSHMNAYIRFKLALTEDNPTIKPYMEGLWAELPDTLDMPISSSLHILEGVHARMAALLKTLTADQLQRTFIHPEHNRTQSIAFTIGSYAWHGKHHLAHVKIAKAA